MKKTLFTLVLPLALLCCGNFATAQPASNSVAKPALTPEEKEKAGYEKHTKAVMDALKLDNAARAAQVHDIMVAQFAAWKAWHAQNDARLKDLWDQYGKARETKDRTIIDNAMAKIDAVYAGFKPQHDAFKAKLATVLTPEQIETVEDVITINKVKITFNAYGEIFPGLTDEQKAFILSKLKAARAEAIDAGAMTEKSAFFKKYKDQIEAYLTAQGYDVKQSYRDFVAKQKAEQEAKKTAARPGAKPADGDKE
jgi:Spy/CpxP family protein refolding chaperone